MATTVISSSGVTFPDGTTQATAAGGGATYTGAKVQVFSSSGTFTVPTGVTAVYVQIFGGGGGGNGSMTNGQKYSGARGGAGMSYISGLTPGASISVTVGAGGAGGVSGGTTGSSGGTSSFGSYCSATGGAGGAIGGGNSGTYTNSSGTLMRNVPATYNSYSSAGPGNTFALDLYTGSNLQTTFYAGAFLPFGGGSVGGQGYSYGGGCCPPSLSGSSGGGAGMSGGGGTCGNTGYGNIVNGGGGAVYGPGTAGNPGTNSGAGAGGGATGGAAGTGTYGGGGGGGGGVIVWY